MKKMYIIPETKISEFKGKQMAICLSIGEGPANEDDALGKPRNAELENEEEWGNLWY